MEKITNPYTSLTRVFGKDYQNKIMKYLQQYKPNPNSLRNVAFHNLKQLQYKIRFNFTYTLVIPLQNKLLNNLSNIFFHLND